MNNVKQKIRKLESLNLCVLTISDIKTELSKLNSFPYNIFPYVSGSRIFRGQVSESKPFELISRISFNPNPSTSIGRANLQEECVFYASGSLDNAAIESCQDQLRNSSQRIFYVTIGEWELQKGIEINLICHSEKAQNSGTDLPIAIEALEPLMRKGRNGIEYKSILLKNQFFANQFAKEEIRHPNDYAYSAIYSSQILQAANKMCDGICFPSVAYKLKGFNFVFSKELFLNNIFTFVGAYYLKLTFESNGKYPKIEILNKTSNFKENRIIWQ